MIAIDGFRVRSVMTPAELQRHLCTKLYRVLVLCHSLSTAERNTAVDMVAQLSADTEILALEAEKPLVRRRVRVMNIDRGPEELRHVMRGLAGSTAVQ